MKASASVFYTREGTFLISIKERPGAPTSNTYGTPLEAKMAVASLRAVYWAPRARQAAFDEAPLTPFPEKPVASLARAWVAL